jgi:hypothetical protein
VRALGRAVVVMIATGLFALFGGASVVTAFGGSSPPGDDARSVAEDQLGRAAAAALAETGGGRVTGTGIDGDEGVYEVEVTLPDDRQVDVRVDASFAVVGTETDGADARGGWTGD